MSRTAGGLACVRASQPHAHTDDACANVMLTLSSPSASTQVDGDIDSEEAEEEGMGDIDVEGPTLTMAV